MLFEILMITTLKSDIIKKKRGKIMAFIESKHTFAAIERIRKELSVFALLISIGSMVVFSVMYAYLLFSNLSNPIYLIAYIILFVVVIVSFVIEMILKVRKTDNRKTIRIKENYGKSYTELIQKIMPETKSFILFEFRSFNHTKITAL